jgi:hypothetical protein
MLKKLSGNEKERDYFENPGVVGNRSRFEPGTSRIQV